MFKTDAISERLRDVCPSLYSDSDAVCTKVHCCYCTNDWIFFMDIFFSFVKAGELLSLARKSVNKSDQSRLLKDALQVKIQMHQKYT